MTVAIDPKAGTHFVGKIFVKPHACDRATEHFGVDRKDAPIWVMDRLRKASLISAHVIDEFGNPARMFGYQRIVFIVHPTEQTVVTIYPQYKANEVIRNPIERIIQRTIRTAERKVQRETKRINIAKAELAMERAGYELRLAKTDSVKVIADMNERIASIDAKVAAFDRELFELQREKTNLMKSVVAYI
ncbi:hypothetical protein RJP21_04960 [Paenibacillus sp. VCA1]|uniref:hypothetical protein n=1 Tax=Paenibacillus sp. VCA1 TaxID=3039148 RepID=UPI002870C11F|nr:hypothetical protein [Paenibacillus sp. VCA1]MDR9852949.1 hypothetical protein [Paenibacillus sp. VCA1]